MRKPIEDVPVVGGVPPLSFPLLSSLILLLFKVGVDYDDESSFWSNLGFREPPSVNSSANAVIPIVTPTAVANL